MGNIRYFSPGIRFSGRTPVKCKRKTIGEVYYRPILRGFELKLSPIGNEDFSLEVVYTIFICSSQIWAKVEF